MRFKLRKRHIFALVILLLPVLVIGVCNFLFSSASFHVVADVEAAGGVSSRWVGDYDGILMTSIISIVITLLWAAGIYTGHTDRYIDEIIKLLRFIKDNPGKTMLHMGILLAIVIAAFAAEAISSAGASIFGLASIVRILFYATAGASLYCIIVFRGKPDKLFLTLSLLIGFLYIAAHPPAWYGWDNRIHYSRSLEESFVINVSVTEADLMLASSPELKGFWSLISGDSEAFEQTGFRDLLADEDSALGQLGFGDLRSGHNNYTLYSFRKGTDTIAEIGSGDHSLYHRLAYIPAGLMLFIGRSLALAPILIVKLGTLGNHLIYTFLVYLAIRRLNSGKYLMAVIAMFPTAFVMSTTYGYDHWVTGFTMLGFAYYFYEVQNPEKKIDLKSIIIIIGAFVIGLGPKAVYVPLILILFFIKKEKFGTEKRHKIYLATVICAVMLLFASFAIPFIASGGGGEGDIRGGSGVNSAMQTMFILQNPFTYAGILLKNLAWYLNIYAHNYVTFFAHLSSASLFPLGWALVGFTALTDRGEKDIHTYSIRYKALVAFVILSTVILIETAMYIGFTEVGKSEIAGLQGRYLLPVLFPFIYIVGSFKIKNDMNKAAYSSGVFALSSLVLLVGAWERLVPHV